jgi:hypothetical protein
MNNHEVDLQVIQKSLDQHDELDEKKEISFDIDNEILR